MKDTIRIRYLLTGIFLMMMFASIYFAKDLLLPIVLGLLLALTLSPLVRGLRRGGIPPQISAVVIVLGIGISGAIGTYAMSGPVTEWVKAAPEMGQKVRTKLAGLTRSVEAVKKASEDVEALADTASENVDRVVVQGPGLLANAVSELASFSTSVIVGLILALFILASGDLFYVKLVEAFPSFREKKRAIKIVRDIERRISHYLLTITLINAGLGLAVGTALMLIGIPYPFIWGAAAFLLNFLPFVGAVIGTLAIAVFSIVTFDSLGYALLAPLAYFTLTSIEGHFVTPMVLGQRLEMNTVSVFLTVVVWGWLWSVPGALMAVPFLVLLKVICDNFDELSVLGNFLSARSTRDEPLEEALPDAALRKS